MTQIDQPPTPASTDSRPEEGPRPGPPQRQNGQQAPPAPQTPQTPQVNVGEAERAVSLAAGSVLALLGLSRRSLTGLVVAGVGGALAYRGVTGHCHTYARFGLDTARGQPGSGNGGQEEEIGEHGIHIEQAFLINRPAEQLYRYWRNFENLPRIMSHLESVRVQDDRHSHWVAKVQVAGSKHFEWDAEITHDEPNALIGWRSLPGADIENAGRIQFAPAIGDRGTDVHVFIDYVPPAGRLGHWIASMLGQNPRRVVREDLRNFKRVMEIGEVLTITGQPHGSCSGRGERQAESEWKPLFT